MFKNSLHHQSSLFNFYPDYRIFKTKTIFYSSHFPTTKHNFSLQVYYFTLSSNSNLVRSLLCFPYLKTPTHHLNYILPLSSVSSWYHLVHIPFLGIYTTMVWFSSTISLPLFILTHKCFILGIPHPLLSSMELLPCNLGRIFDYLFNATRLASVIT